MDRRTELRRRAAERSRQRKTDAGLVSVRSNGGWTVGSRSNGTTAIVGSSGTVVVTSSTAGFLPDIIA